jgi:zinc protease
MSRPLVLVIVSACGLGLAALSSVAREQPPAPGPAHKFVIAPPQTLELENGLKTTFIPFGKVPKVAIEIVVRSGELDGGNQTWLPDLAGALMKEGTQLRSSEAISQQAALMGGEVGLSVGAEETSLSIDVLSEKAPAALQLLAEILTQPALPEREFSRLLQDRLRDLSIARTQPETIAAEAFDALMYPDHPFGRALPTEAQLSKYTIEDAKRFYRENFGAQRTHIYIAGQFDRVALENTLRASLAKWPRGPAPLVLPPTPSRTLQVRLINRPGAPQSTIRLGVPVIKVADPTFMQLSMANTVLGGSLVSRITENLRETHGWAYSPSASIAAQSSDATWVEAADVTTDATALAIAEIFAEIKKLQTDAPANAELEAAKNYRNGIFVLSNATREGLISQFAFMDLLGLPQDWLTTYIDRMYAVQPAQISAAVRTHIDPTQMTLVVVGDMKKVRASIEALPALHAARFLD